MNIVSAANDKYVRHLCVMLKSLLLHASNPQDVNIYILQSDFSTASRLYIEKLGAYFKSNVQLIDVHDETINRIEMNPYSAHISRETYYRIETPNLVPESVEKAIYLDCDIVVLDDLRKVWEIDLNDYALGAVVDFLGVWEGEDLVTPKGYSYFNAGFLLMDLHKWRKEDVAAKLKTTLLENSGKLKYMDQDALNHIFYRKYLQLELKWNYQTYFWRHNILDRPSVIHFTGPEKPWNSSTAYNNLYDYYLNFDIVNEKLHAGGS